MSFGSLLRHEDWWIRALDFPRLQLAGLALALLVAALVLLDLRAPTTWSVLAALCACLLYQGWWIVPYTPWYPKEVWDSEGGEGGEALRIMVANVLTPNRRADELLAQVRRHRPDVLVAVETDEWWERALDALMDEMPHRVRCPLDNLYGMHVYSRLPLHEPRIEFLVEHDVPSIHALLELESGQYVELHAVHPAPPSPTENDESVERDAELVIVGRMAARSRLPVVVTGDLNDVAWSATTRLFRRISGLLDPRVGRGMFNTFHAKWPFLRWPLDHLFHTDDFTLVRLQRLRYFGSDHFPILVELAHQPKQGEDQEGLGADAEDQQWAQEKVEDAR